MNRTVLLKLFGIRQVIIIMSLAGVVIVFPKVNYAGTPYKSPQYSFSLELPDGWAAIDTAYSVMHYRDVFLCVNNIAAETLAIADKREGTLVSYNPSAVAEQLQPGTVYVDFAFFEGPGIGPHFCGKRIDSFEENRESLFQEKIPDVWNTDYLTTQHVDFFKWGHRWSVFVYFREPVPETDKLAAFHLLKNLKFLELPITTPIQAGAVAAANAPPDVLDSVMQIEEDGGCGGLCVHSLFVRDCERNGTNFLVTLQLSGRRDEPSPKWKYLVSMDGRAILMESVED